MSERSPRRAVLAIAAVVAVAVVAALALWRLSGGASVPPAPPAGPAPVAARPAPTAPVRPAPALPAPPAASTDVLPAYRVGMQATYDVLLTSATSFELGESMHQQLKDVRVELSGRWTVTVVAVDDDEVHLAATLGAPRFTLSPESDVPEMEATRRGLASRHYFTVSARGTVQATHFPKGADPMARSLLKSVIATAQVTLPETRSDAWQVEEQAQEGEVLVAYGRLPGDGASLEKRVVRYVRVAALGGPVPAGEVGAYTISGRAELGVDAFGWLATRDGQETLRVAPEGGMLTVEERRTSRFVLRQRREAPELALDFQRDWPHLETSTLVDVQRLLSNQDAVDRAWVDGASLSSLLAALRATVPGEAGAQARAMLVPRLAALLRLEPRQAAELATLARQEGDTQTSQTILAALSSAGTPEAQQALVDLGGDPTLPRLERLRAVGLLGLSKTPVAGSGAALEGWLSSEDRDVADTSALALGNHVKRRQEDGGAVATAETADLVQALIKALEAAQTPEERTLYLKALGNTGDPRAVPAIVAQLATDNVSVRAAAIWALRFMPGAEVDALLVEALTKDPALAPRQAVVGGAAFRSLVPLGPGLDRMARAYPDKALRLDIVHLLGVSKDRYPPGLVTLKWVAENDGAADVRQAAQAALKPMTVPGATIEIVP